MKYVKYGLLGILFVFLLKGIGLIADSQEFMPGSMVAEERGFKTDNIENLNIHLAKANVSITYANIEDISIVSSLTPLQKKMFTYNYIANSENNTLEISQYFNRVSSLDDISSYGKINIYIPKNFDFSGINIVLEEGSLNTNINATNFTYQANSSKTKIEGKFDQFNVKQKVGMIDLNQLNAKALTFSSECVQLGLNSVTSETIDVTNQKTGVLNVKQAYAQTLNINGKYKDVHFANMAPMNYQLVADKVNNSDLTLSGDTFTYQMDDKSTMRINAPGVKVDQFRIKQ